MSNLNFLYKGGEMAQLIREKDWISHPLGSPDDWPQSLKTTLSIILSSNFPNFLFWGKDLFCFYNDAYKPSLGIDGKHPNILGQKANIAWVEIWHIIKPSIDQVLETGDATWSENQLIPFYRNGKIEDIYWTYSYSPIIDETNSVTGVFVSCLETTSTVNHLNHLEKLNNRYYNNIKHAPLAMCIFTGKDFVVEIANDLMLAIWDKQEHEIINKPIFEGLKEAKGQGFLEIMNNVYQKGEKFEAFERPVMLPRGDKSELFYLNFVCEPIKNDENIVTSIVTIATDVTTQVLGNQKIKQNEAKLNIIIEASELGVWEYDMHTQEGIVSDRYAEILNFKNKDEISSEKILKKLHPGDLEIRNQAEIDVIKTGELKYETRIIWDDKSIHWVAARGKMFFDAENKPLKMIGTIRDITNEKHHEQILKDREEKFRLLADEMPQFVWTADAEGNVDYFNKSLYNFTGLNTQILIDNGWVEFVHPEDSKKKS
jgi:PAS domain S-box-containing protein